jgi:hypothetical protein
VFCKLTTKDMKTRDGRQWTLGEWQTASGRGLACDDGWLAAYADPLLAAFCNPSHENLTDPLVFEVETRGKFLDDYSCFAATEMRLVRPLPSLLEIDTQRRIRFGILCAFRSTMSGRWMVWAENWLSGKDRTRAEAQRVGAEVNLPWVGREPMPRCFVPAACWATRSVATSDPGEVKLFSSLAAGKVAAEVWCDTPRALDLLSLAKEAMS